MNDFLAFDGDNLVHRGGKLQRLPASDCVFFGDDCFDWAEFVLRKKLLRSGAGVSALPVVHPFGVGHVVLLENRLCG